MQREQVVDDGAVDAWLVDAPGAVGVVGENALVKVAGLVGDVGALTRLARKFGGGGGWGEALEAFLDGAQGVGVYWRGAGEQEAVNVVAVDDIELAVVVAVAVDAGESAAFPGEDVGGAAAEGVIDGKIVGFGEIPGVFQEAIGIVEVSIGANVVAESLGEDFQTHVVIGQRAAIGGIAHIDDVEAVWHADGVAASVVGEGAAVVGENIVSGSRGDGIGAVGIEAIG